MKYLFDFAFLPDEELKTHDCRLVVDLLRASTQITVFFDAGGGTLLPVTGVDEAKKLRASLGSGWKLMGERGGLSAPGFDFGNSPSELIHTGAPSGAVITTSNGTRAIVRAVKDCREVYIACARNAESAAWKAVASGTKIGIIASGEGGSFSFEDTVCSGLLIERMLTLAPQNGGTEMELTDGAIAALDLWHKYGRDFTAFCMATEHGKKLCDLGFAEDVKFCCAIDATERAPYITRYKNMTAIKSE